MDENWGYTQEPRSVPPAVGFPRILGDMRYVPKVGPHLRLALLTYVDPTIFVLYSYIYQNLALQDL